MKKQLEQLRRQVERFRQLCLDYPECKEYSQSLRELEQQYVDLLNKLGRTPQRKSK